MPLPPYITVKNVLMAVLAIGVIILFIILFKGNSSSTNQDLVKQLIAAKDSVIAAEKGKIELHERLIEEKDITVEILQRQDSVLNVHYNEAELTYKKIDEKLRSVSNRINSVSGNRDSLRAIFREF